MYASTIPLSWKHNDYTGYLTHHIWHHSHYICVITQMAHTSVSTYRSIDDIKTSVYVITLGTSMTSYPIYLPSHSHYMTWMIMFYVITYTKFMTTDLSMTSYPLFRTSHHFMYEIKSTVSVSSNPRYQLYHTHSLYVHQTLYVWHHIQYACYHNCLGHYTPLCITSHPLYLWHHIQEVRYHHTAFMKTQQIYRTSHPPYLTSQPLFLCHHTDGTDICIDVSLYADITTCV